MTLSSTILAPQVETTAEELLDRLRKALKRDGDFPASAKIVNRITELTSDPKTTVNQLTELILQDPSLGMRLLHLVNSAMYHRGTPIMTVSQAVLQVGMKPLAELCSSLVLLQKFVPAARQGGAFATCLKRSILSSLLSHGISVETAGGEKAQGSRTAETGQLNGWFAEMGTLLLAFYFPQIYDNAVKRAESKGQDVSHAIKVLTGLSPFELSIEVLEALEMPVMYIEVLRAAEEVKRKPIGAAAPKSELLRSATNIGAATQVSHVISAGKPKEELDKVMAQLGPYFGNSLAGVNKRIGTLEQDFKSYCSTVELTLPALPSFLHSYSPGSSDGGDDTSGQEGVDAFAEYVKEIRSSVDSREPTASIITTVMETCMGGLHFDRVLMMLLGAGRGSLNGRIIIGDAAGIDASKIIRQLADEPSSKRPELTAFFKGQVVTSGYPIIEGGWPFAVMPIGFGKRAFGVLYMDRTTSKASELSAKELAGLSVLAGLLDTSIQGNQGG